MPSESFWPEFHQIDEFNFNQGFVNSDNSASHSLGQTNLRKIRPSFRDGPFGADLSFCAPLLQPHLEFPDVKDFDRLRQRAVSRERYREPEEIGRR